MHITRDGGQNWANVTPKDMPEWGRVSQIEASPFDAGTAYMAVDRHKMDDFTPYIFKTTDFGKTWTKLVNGIPADDYVRAVREDPKKRGLLFAGTEKGVYVSFNDGGKWQPLQLNLPTAPVHDLIVKNDDLVRGDSRPLVLDPRRPGPGAAVHRLTSRNKAVHLYTPADAYRIHNPGGEDRHHAELAGQNPPRRGDRLLREAGSQGRNHDRDSRWPGQGDPEIFQQED